MSLTIQNMHIGIDLGLQQLDSNVFSKIKPEHKDYAINTLIVQRYTDLLIAAQNARSNELTYSEILKFYNKLAPILTTKKLNVFTGDNRYVYANLPTDEGVNISSGVLVAGVEYKFIQSAGVSGDFTNVGATSTNKGDTFTCTIADMSTNGSDGNLVITAGGEYQITMNNASVDFTTYGALNSAVGTWFTATSSGTISYAPINGISTSVSVLKAAPTSWGNAILAPMTNYGIMGFLSSRSLVDVGRQISSGAIEANKQYKVLTAGSTNFSSYGGMASPKVGYIFSCTADGTPTWDGTSVITEVKYVQNDLIKIHDEENFLDHAFGTSINNPISSMSGNTLRIYHDGEFTVNQVEVIYGRYPRQVDYNNSISSELHYNELSKIVDEVVERIAGRTGNPVTAVIAQENNEKL